MFCVTQPFSTCVHMLPKVFRAYMQNFVASIKNYTAIRKITMSVTLTALPKDKQQSVIQLLMLENVSGSKIHVRICAVYGVQNVITKSTVIRQVQRFKVGRMCTKDKP